jgi:hypothetical protein
MPSTNAKSLFIENNRAYYVWIRGTLYAEMRSTTVPEGDVHG